MTSNIDKEVFKPDETVVVSVWDENTMDEGIYSLDMKGRLKKLAEGPYIYAIHRFSDNQKYCIWNRQNMSEFRDLWWSKADFSDPIRITNANPQQSEYNGELQSWWNGQTMRINPIREYFICRKIMILKKNILYWYNSMKRIRVD